MMHFLSSANFIMLILVSVILLSFIVSFLFKPEEFPKSRVNVFISIMASVTVILIGLSLAVSSVTLHEGESLIRVYTTKEAIDKLWLLPNRMLATSTQSRPEFLKSFYYNNPHLKESCSDPVMGKEQTCLSVIEEQNIAITMIQSWEDFLTMRDLDATGDIVWINNFIQWAQSPYLKEYFDLLKYNYKATTIQLGNILFQFAAKIPRYTSNPETFHETAIAVLNDPYYKELISLNEYERKHYVVRR